MSDLTPPSLPQAVVHRARFQWIWLIPIVAALVAGYLAYDAISSRGPTITLNFRSADGLKAGITKVRHKAVDLGTVRDIKLSDDLSHVEVRVEMQRTASGALSEHARFWVVRPRLTAGNVSGLDTVLSGAYIELDPGAPADAGAEMRTAFVGLEEPPSVRSDEPGQSYVLRAARIGGITSGSPVLYRDVTVGEVLRWDIAPDGLGFTVAIFVRRPFDRFMHEGTHFWNASGIGLDLGANGVQLRLESLQALVSGAIAFDTAADARTTPVSAQGAEFRLYRDEPMALAAGYKRRLPFLTRFKGSVRGLAVGAPVEVYGIQVGSVTGIRLFFDPSGSETHVDVMFEIQPERILSAAEIDAQSPFETTRTMVNRGLRMQLHTANYLTGQMLMGMDFVPDAPPGEAQQMEDGRVFVPGISGGLDNLAATATDLMQKIDHIPFEQIGARLSETLAGTAALTNGPEIGGALTSLQRTLAGVAELVRKVDVGSAPLLRRLPAMSQGLDAALARTATLVGSADQAYGSNSQVRRDTERLLAQLSDTARSVRLLADYLSQHPEALIQGRTGKAPER